MDNKPVLYRCPWYIQVKGYDANLGKEVENWGCAIAWMPALMINTANEVRQGAAATESFRNDMVKQGQEAQKVLIAAKLGIPQNFLGGGNASNGNSR